MEPTKKELEERYRSLSNKKLEAIVTLGTHSAVAVEVAVNELRSRGVELAKTKAPNSTSTETADDDSTSIAQGVDLKVAYRTFDILQANIVRNLLESEGVFAYVRGANLGVTHIIISIAGGDMRVEVREDQLAQAKEIIAKFERGEYKLEGEGKD